MTQSKHQIILLNGEMASGKSTTLQFLVRKLQQDSSGGDYGTSTKTIDFVGFIQPSVFAWDNKPPCTNTSKTTDTSCSNHSLESLVLNETHRKAIEIHFIDSSKEGSQIFTLATLNPEFKSLDHEPSSNMIKVMEENIKSKRPQQPRWLFNVSIYFRRRLNCSLKETELCAICPFNRMKYLKRSKLSCSQVWNT